MRWPPYLLKLRFTDERRDFALWLPLFLLWPLVLAFLLAAFLVILPFALLSLVFTLELDWLKSLALGMLAIFRVLGQLPSLMIDVQGERGTLYLEFV